MLAALRQCVVFYQSDCGAADIRLCHPPCPGSVLSVQTEARHFTTDPTGQFFPVAADWKVCRVPEHCQDYAEHNS